MEARFAQRLNECKTEAELAEYLLDCVPIIKEYTTETVETVTTQNVLGVKISTRKGLQRQDIYNRYLNEVEGQYDAPVKIKEEYLEPCKGCGEKFTRIFDEVLSEDV